MGLSYTVIAGILLYFSMVKVSANSRISALSAGLIVVVGYLVITATVQLIMFSAYGLSLASLFNLSLVITTLLQLILAIFIFRRLDQTEDNYTAWLALGAAGCLAIFFLIPYLVGNLPL